MRLRKIIPLLFLLLTASTLSLTGCGKKAPPEPIPHSSTS